MKVSELRLPASPHGTRRPKPKQRASASLPAATDPEAHELFLSIARFDALAPWRWMQNGDVFGARDPATGEIGWCSVMGAGGELFGLAVYRGDAGYEFLRRAESGDFFHDEALYGQPAIVLSFLDRADLSKADHALIRRAGAKFRGAGCWPQIESHGLNRLPVPPEPGDMRFLREVLEQVVEVAPRVRQSPELVEPDAEGRLLLRVRNGAGADGEWQDARRAPPPPSEPPPAALDRVRAEHIRCTLPGAGIEVECDLFPMQAIIAEPGASPHAPAAFLAVHAEIGAVLHLSMTEPAGREEWAVGEFLGMIEQVGGVPAVVYVQRPALARLLQPAANAVGARIELVEELMLLEQVRAMMEEATTRSR